MSKERSIKKNFIYKLLYEILAIIAPLITVPYVSRVLGTEGVGIIEFGTLHYRENEAMIFAGNNEKLQNIVHYPFPNNYREGILDTTH